MSIKFGRPDACDAPVCPVSPRWMNVGTIGEAAAAHRMLDGSSIGIVLANANRAAATRATRGDRVVEILPLPFTVVGPLHDRLDLTNDERPSGEERVEADRMLTGLPLVSPI